MIDQQGKRLYSEMMCLIWADENFVSKEVETAMVVFDTHMNRLNKTTGMLYAKNCEVLMESGEAKEKK
jgi:hypothetical protein